MSARSATVFSLDMDAAILLKCNELLYYEVYRDVFAD